MGTAKIIERIPAFTRHLAPCFYQHYDGRQFTTFVTVKWSGDGRLSLTGVEGPMSNGDARGSCGQVSRPDKIIPAPGWTTEMVTRLWDIWDAWHLNDMRAGCIHQRKNWDVTEKLEVVGYGLTYGAYRLRQDAIAKAEEYAARGELAPLSAMEKALMRLEDWYSDKCAAPDADSPLSGCYEVKKRETKAAGWVYPHEHSRGLLSKPCEICGYKYGTAWLKEEVPADVLKELQAFPLNDNLPTCWQQL